MDESLNQLVKETELLDVWLKQSSCSCRTLPPSIDFTKVEISTNYDMEFNFQPSAGVLTCFITCYAVGTIEKEEHFSFQNQFVLLYKTEKSEVKENTLKDFTKTTALFNAYPFHREQIHTQSVKMGLPPLIIPLLKSYSLREEKDRESVKAGIRSDRSS
ncbi:MAG: hypothetical protein OXB88_07330 [Bacteriovoracales bacterium]|nr:hypothetical protein [Bacteriovoracales bacterium]